jgi:2-methylcitrate synthase
MYDAKGLHPNLDYPAGPACHLIGFDTPNFTPVFVAARLPGWTGPAPFADTSRRRRERDYLGQRLCRTFRGGWMCRSVTISHD